MNYPDYGEARVIAGYLNNNANGTGTLRLAYKNDVANSNGTDPSSLYGNGSPDTLWPDNPAWVAGDPRAPGTGMGGTLATVNGASIIGKWSIAFTSNTSVTTTAEPSKYRCGRVPGAAVSHSHIDSAQPAVVPMATSKSMLPVRAPVPSPTTSMGAPAPCTTDSNVSIPCFTVIWIERPSPGLP